MDAGPFLFLCRLNISVTDVDEFNIYFIDFRKNAKK